MAIERLFRNTADPDTVLVDGPTIQISRPVALEAPRAAGFLATLPGEHRVLAVEELLEHGAAAAAATQTSAHIVLLETRIEELSEHLRCALGEQLGEAGKASSDETARLLTAHKDALVKLLVPLTDPNLKDGLPSRMAELLDRVNRDALKRLESMLADADEGALGKAVRSIVKEIKETGLAISKEIGAGEGLLRRSNLRGGRFEEVLAVELGALVRMIGRVEHCGLTPGARDGNAGDYVVTIDHAAGSDQARIAVEAKSVKQRMGANAIRAELKAARANRGAQAGILVAEGRGMLPGGVPIGQVADADFFAAFDPQDGDDTALACALYMARVAAIAAMSTGRPATVDIAAALHEVEQIRTLVGAFARLEGHHSRADKAIDAARTVAADLKAELLGHLRRLDGILA